MTDETKMHMADRLDVSYSTFKIIYDRGWEDSESGKWERLKEFVTSRLKAVPPNSSMPFHWGRGNELREILAEMERLEKEQK